PAQAPTCPPVSAPPPRRAASTRRVAAGRRGAAVPLPPPVRIRRFKGGERPFPMGASEAIPAVTEDMLRRPEVWKRLGRELRPGDYANRYPKTLKAFDVVRNKEAFETFNSKVEAGPNSRGGRDRHELLEARAGGFHRAV